MTTRVYLKSAKLLNDTPQASDLPVERIFINTSDVPEVWVEIESHAVPEIGKAASFALVRSLDLGFRRITGTIERRVKK